MSVFVALLVFINQLWNSAELERTVTLAFGAGMGVYLILVVGFAAIVRIAERPPRKSDPSGSSEAGEASEPQPAAG